MNTQLQLAAVALLAALCYMAAEVDAECCYIPFHCSEPNNVKKYRCLDCTESTVYCGLGKCNVFGCNCDGGCRKGNDSLWCWNPVFNCSRSFHAVANLAKLSSPKTYVAKLIDVFDEDRNQVLNFEEFGALIKAQEPNSQWDLQHEFETIDVNQDGLISLREIDGDLF